MTRMTLIVMMPVMFVCLTSSASSSQEHGRVIDSDDLLWKRYDLERAFLDARYWKDNLAKEEKLYERGLVSEAAFLKTKQNYENAILNLKRALESYRSQSVDFIVEGATKYVAQDGQRRVRLLIRSVGSTEDLAVSLEEVGVL